MLHRKRGEPKKLSVREEWENMLSNRGIPIKIPVLTQLEPPASTPAKKSAGEELWSFPASSPRSVFYVPPLPPLRSTTSASAKTWTFTMPSPAWFDTVPTSSLDALRPPEPAAPYVWGPTPYMTRSMRVLQRRSLYLCARFAGIEVARITGWRQPHREIARELGPNWERVPKGRYCVDVECSGFEEGPLLVHKERSFRTAEQACAWIALCVFFIERMDVDDWIGLHAESAKRPWRMFEGRDCPMT